MSPTKKAEAYARKLAKDRSMFDGNDERIAVAAFKAGHAEGRREALEMAQGLVEALKYYADEKNWYNVNRDKAGAPELRMVIGSIDTSGSNWLGGHQARLALAKFEAWREGK